MQEIFFGCKYFKFRVLALFHIRCELSGEKTTFISKAKVNLIAVDCSQYKHPIEGENLVFLEWGNLVIVLTTQCSPTVSSTIKLNFFSLNNHQKYYINLILH